MAQWSQKSWIASWKAQSHQVFFHEFSDFLRWHSRLSAEWPLGQRLPDTVVGKAAQPDTGEKISNVKVCQRMQNMFFLQTISTILTGTNSRFKGKDLASQKIGWKSLVFPEKDTKKHKEHWSLFDNLDVFGCFLKWWYPQNTPKWSFLVGKPMVVGYHHFRKPPFCACGCHAQAFRTQTLPFCTRLWTRFFWGEWYRW